MGGEETAGRGREESEKTSKHSSHLVVHTNMAYGGNSETIRC